jgi:hypothetical protein
LRLKKLVPILRRHHDYHLTAVVGILVGAYLAFAIALYWLMQPAVATNYGMAVYRPPPKTIVRDASSPWVPPGPEPQVAQATVNPEPELVTSEPVAEPKKQRKQEVRSTARQTRPARQEQNSLWGYASSRSGGSRPWF